MECDAMASDFFIKFDDFDNSPAHKLETDFLKFGHDFFQAGDALDDLFKVVDDAKVTHGDIVIVKHIDATSAAFVNLGSDTNNLGDLIHKFDDSILNFADQQVKIESPSESNQPPLTLADDFIKFDTDFHAAGLEAIKLGLDTLKLDVGGENANEAMIKFAGDISDFGDSLHKVSDDFLKVSQDFIKLAGLSDSDTVDQAFIKLGSGALKVSDELHKVSDDFLKIAADITGSNDNLNFKITDIAFKFGDDFHKLDSDLHKLSVDVSLLGNDYIKLASVLPGNEHGTGPSDGGSPVDALHQVLQHVHDFSLL
jgi:hypothetical protein